MTDFTRRINEVLDHTGISNYRLAKDLRLSKSTIGNYRKGKSSPNGSILNSIAEYLEKEGISSRWLLTGEGDMIGKDPIQANIQDSETPAYSRSKTSKKGVPYYDIDFTLSFVGVDNNQQVQPDTYVTHPFFDGCDYIVRASGQSMAKVIKHGDAMGLTKIENWQEFIPLGEVYAIVTNNGFRMVKVITKGKDEHHFKLISKPSDSKKDEFPDQEIKKSTIIQLFKLQASSHLF